VKARTWLLAGVLASGGTGAGIFLTLGGSRRTTGGDDIHSEHSMEAKMRPDLPAFASYREASNDPLTWSAWVALVPCIRAPTTEDGMRRIVVFIRLPSGTPIELDGPRNLRLPEGTEAARVEYQADSPDQDAIPNSAFRVLDVRGTTLGTQGAQYNILRPTHDQKKLLGFAWNPKLTDTRDAAGALIRSGLLLGPNDARAATRFQDIHDCAGCHTANRVTAAVGRVHRGTDSQGFFGVRSVFEDESPFETYRPRNANTGDPFIATELAPPGSPPGTASFGRLHVSAGLAAGDRHVQQVCAARRALSQAFSAAATRAFARELRDCALLSQADAPKQNPQ
jgi:hypothetical protein